MSRFFNRRSSPFLALIALGASLAFFGAFHDDDEDDDVPSKIAAASRGTANTLSGTVTLNGNVLTSGGTLILFGRESTQPAASGIIQPNGTYLIKNAPTGQVQLCFSTEKELGKRTTDATPGKNGLRSRKLGLGKEGDKENEVVRFKKKSPSTNRIVADLPALKKRLLYDLQVKKESAKSVAEAAKKYGRLGLPDAIKTVLLEGDNTFDVDLKVSTPEPH